MSDKTQVKAGDGVWLVKYALRGGAEHAFVRGVFHEGSVTLDGWPNSSYFRLGRDVFVSWEEAVEAMEVMREKRIASLKKQIAKLEVAKW